jgi:hypothetical protein
MAPMHNAACLLLKIQFGLLVPKPVDMETTASRAQDHRKPHDRPPRFTDTLQTAAKSWSGRFIAVLHEPSTVRGLLGVFLLVLGTGVYLLDRSWQQLAIAQVIPLTHARSPVFGVLGGSLPSFAHVCAFALLTAALLDGGRRLNQLICFGWLAVNVAFELGQHPKLATFLANAVPAWFAQIAILDKTPTYFLGGTFDPLDLLFATLGALAAYLVIVKTHAPGVGHEV